MMEIIKKIKYDEKGLVPAIVQDYKTGTVLMMAYMNEDAVEKTIKTGKTHFWSRSRQKLWLKGETSGHFQFVKDIRIDCDEDCLLIMVDQVEAACHTNNYSCFYRVVEDDKVIERNSVGYDKTDKSKILKDVYNIIVDRVKNPKEGSYTNYLFDKGIDKMLKKVGEESAEVIIAAKNKDKGEITYEVSDLIYHLLVVLVENEVTLDEIFAELENRK